MITEPDTIVVSQISGESPSIEEQAVVIEVGIMGGQGPQGLPGSSAAFNYHYQQVAPAASWDIVHNLNGFPNVTVVDSGGSQVEGDVHYVSANELILTFSSGFAGDAYLS